MVGFSAFVSVGSMLDVGWGDLIQYLGDDPAHAQHRDLYGIGRRRARFLVGRPGSRALETDHRDQDRAHGGCGEGRGLAHGALTAGRSSRCGFSPMRGAARQHHRRTFLSVRGPGQAAASKRSSSGDRDERRRTRGSRHRCTCSRRGLSGRAFSGDHGRARTDACRLTGAISNPIDIIGDADAERYSKAVELSR